MQLRNGRQLFPEAPPSTSPARPAGLSAPAAGKRKGSSECSDDLQQKQKQQKGQRRPKVWSDIGIESLISVGRERGAPEALPERPRPSKAALLLGAGAESISAPQQSAAAVAVADAAGTALAPATPGQATPSVVTPPPRPGVLWGQAELQAACDALAAAEPRLRPLMEQHGLPVRLLRKGGSSFATLAKSICFQQVTTAAGAAIFGRLLAACGCADVLTPAAALATEVPAMRAAGLSERKASYIKDLARHFQEGHLSDEALAEWDDAMLHARLTAVKGLGDWSVDMHSMFHLGHADVLPVGDLGVRRGMQAFFSLRDLPTPAAMEVLTAHWAPYRSIGSFYMWRIEVPPSLRKSKKK